jgi:DNA-binding XRE family transcriptional regulator
VEAMTLKQSRLVSGKTQEQMAKLLGVSNPTYIKWEQNPELMSLKTAKKIAEILNRPIDLFFIYSEK